MTQIGKLFNSFATGAATVLTEKKDWAKVKRMSTAKNADVWGQVWKKSARPAAIKALEEADLGLSKAEIASIVDDYGSSRKLPFIRQTTKTDIGRLKKLARSKGDLEGDIKKAGISKPSRVDLIEFEESKQAKSFALRDAHEMMGFTTRKWVAGGHKTCEICNAKAGQVVGIRERYKGGEEIAHAHNHCQCHDEYGGQIKYGLRSGSGVDDPVPEEGSFEIPEPLEGEELVTLDEKRFLGKDYGLFPNGHKFFKSTHKGIDIYESVNREGGSDFRVYSGDAIKKALDFIPESLIKASRCKEIIASPVYDPKYSQEELLEKYGKGFQVAGQLNLKTLRMTLFPDTKSTYSVDTQTVAHELAHGVDYNPRNKAIDSSNCFTESSQYFKAVNADALLAKEHGDPFFASTYAEKTYKNTGKLDEDFADFAGNVINDPRERTKYPNRYKELRHLVIGDIDKELDEIDKALEEG